jgi:hypothetical protein
MSLKPQLVGTDLMTLWTGEVLLNHVSDKCLHVLYMQYVLMYCQVLFIFKIIISLL